MSDQNIFSQGQTTDPNTNSGAASPQTASSSDPIADLLGSIKNEKGEPKYRDVTTALDALKHSQEFIPQIKQENDTLKNELAQLREQVSKLSQIEQTVQKLTSTSQEQQPQAAPAFDEKTVAELVTKTLTAQQQKAIQQANTQTVVNAMKESFGQEAEKMFYTKAAELGMQPEDINSLAAKTPQAVLKLFGLTDNKSTQSKLPTPTTGGINTAGYVQKPDTFVKKNDKGVLLGATTNDVVEELRAASQLVNELHSQGLSAYDLTDPKVYFKHFK